MSDHLHKLKAMDQGCVYTLSDTREMAREAAKEIETLRARVAELEHWFNDYRTPELSMAEMHKRMEAAEAKVAELERAWRQAEQESKRLQVSNSKWETLAAKLSNRAEAAEARAKRWSKYSQHRQVCERHSPELKVDKRGVVRKCTCGLDKLSKEQEKVK